VKEPHELLNKPHLRLKTVQTEKPTSLMRLRTPVMPSSRRRRQPLPQTGMCTWRHIYTLFLLSFLEYLAETYRTFCVK